MGLEDETSKLLEEIDVHLIGDGVVGAGGRVAGERVLTVADRMLDGRYGGTRKCK